MHNALTVFAAISGLLQATGYATYIWKSLRNEVEPNPSTWFMFAYGTLLLTFLERDQGAEWYLLVLPVVCATLSILVAFMCWMKGTLVWPKERLPRVAFIMDIALTVAYVYVNFASKGSTISVEDKKELVLLFLLLSNSSTLVSFLPLWKGVWDEPKCEHPLPWTIWSVAYATLAILTIAQEGHPTVLLIYPVTNAIFHGMVACLAARKGGKSPSLSTHAT